MGRCFAHCSLSRWLPLPLLRVMAHCWCVLWCVQKRAGAVHRKPGGARQSAVYTHAQNLDARRSRAVSAERHPNARAGKDQTQILFVEVRSQSARGALPVAERALAATAGRRPQPQPRGPHPPHTGKHRLSRCCFCCRFHCRCCDVRRIRRWPHLPSTHCAAHFLHRRSDGKRNRYHHHGRERGALRHPHDRCQQWQQQQFKLNSRPRRLGTL
jgi:hypothetical protein